MPETLVWQTCPTCGTEVTSIDLPGRNNVPFERGVDAPDHIRQHTPTRCRQVTLRPSVRKLH